MQVNNATVVPFFPVVIGGSTTTATPSTPAQIDRALLHVTVESFTSLVSAAKAFPEVRSDLVSTYKAQVANGSYPSEETVSGLATLMSGSAE